MVTIPARTKARNPSEGRGVPGIPTVENVPQVRVSESRGVPTVPKAETGGLEEVGGSLFEVGARLNATEKRIQDRKEAVDRAEILSGTNNALADEFSRISVEGDLSKNEDLVSFGGFVSKAKNDAINRFQGSEEGRLRLMERLNHLEGEYIGQAAAESARVGRKKVTDLMDATVSRSKTAVMGNPESMDSVLALTLKQIREDFGALNPNEEVAKERAVRAEHAESAISGYLLQGRDEEALATLQRPDVAESLGAQRQQQIFNNITTAKNKVANAQAVARATETGKLMARADVMSQIFQAAGLDQAQADAAAGEVNGLPSTTTPFKDGAASEDSQNVSRLLSASKRLLMIGDTATSSALMAQARFIMENSPDIQRQKELDKPISDDLASELGVPVGTPLRAVAGRLPRTPEAKAESGAAATARGRGRVEAEEQAGFISEANDVLQNLMDEIDLDPGVVGIRGSFRSAGQTVTGILADVGASGIVDQARDIAFSQTDASLGDIEGWFDSPTLSVLGTIENSVGLILARLRTPAGRIPVDVIKRSIEDVKLTGFTSSKQVANRLKFVQNMLGTRSGALNKRFGLDAPESTPRYRVKGGVLEEVK